MVYSFTFNLLTGDTRQAEPFCFKDADCLVVVESQGSSLRSARKYTVKPMQPKW